MQEHESENNLKEINDLSRNWDEASLAQLLGFNDESQSKNQLETIDQTTSGGEVAESKSEVSTQNAIATHELFDDPQSGKTQPTFYGNPFAKFGAVGLVMLVVFGAGATVLNSIMSGKPKVAPTIANKQSSRPKLEIADNANPQETETGKLKAELALGSQAEKMKSVEYSKSLKTPVTQRKIQPKNELNKRTAPRIASREIRPAQVSYFPRRMPQSSRYYPPAVASVPRFQPVASRVLAPPFPKQQESTDVMEQWSKISRLGSYGSTEIVPKTEERPNSNIGNTTVNEQQTLTIPRATLISEVSKQTVEIADSTELEPLHTEEAAVINGAPVEQLTVGASASGELLTPLIWGKRSTNNTSKKSLTPTEGDKFIVQLAELNEITIWDATSGLFCCDRLWRGFAHRCF